MMLPAVDQHKRSFHPLRVVVERSEDDHDNHVYRMIGRDDDDDVVMRSSGCWLDGLLPSP